MMILEQKLQTELNDLKKDFDSLRDERDFLKINNSRAASDKAKVEQELMNCRCHLKESRQQLDKLNGTCEELRQIAKKAHARYKCIAEELKTVDLERENRLAAMNKELAKKDEELKKVKEENEALAEIIDKLAKKDEELKVLKVESEASLAEMTEKLAKKDGEYIQLCNEKNVVLEDLVARIRFLEEDMKKYDVDAMHNKTGYSQEALLENSSPALESSDHKGSCDGLNSAVVGENGGPDPEVKTLQNAVCQQMESEMIPNTLPTIPAEPSANIPVIDLSSDDQNEGLASTFRATSENGNDHRLKRDRSMSCTTDSDYSFCRQFREKKRPGNNGSEQGSQNLV